METKMYAKNEMISEIKKGNKNLPKISREEFQNTNNTWDLFFLLLSKYYEIVDIETDDNFTNSQHTLMAYNIMYGEITTGGFLELIRNGYGNYIFDTLISETLKKWGIIEIAANINKAKEIYLENKNELEIACRSEDILDMYKKYPVFNKLDNEFFRIMNSEAEKIKLYIQKNIDDFAIVA